MRNQDNKFLKKDEDSLSRRGETIYYLGTLFFVAGIILLSFASASIMFFQISSISEARLIIDTVTYMGCGLLAVSIGINLMLRQSKKGYVTFSIGIIFAIIGIVLFYLNFATNWYYPMVSYILLSYLLGFLLLMGNAFGHVTLWILRKNQEFESPTGAPVKTQHEYTDEEIQRDIDEAIKQSLQHAADELQFDIKSKPSFKVSGGIASESVVRRRDDTNESMVLQQTLNPGSTDQWGGAGIDKAASLLANTLSNDSSYKKKFFHFLRK